MHKCLYPTYIIIIIIPAPEVPFMIVCMCVLIRKTNHQRFQYHKKSPSGFFHPNSGWSSISYIYSTQHISETFSYFLYQLFILRHLPKPKFALIFSFLQFIFKFTSNLFYFSLTCYEFLTLTMRVFSPYYYSRSY